MSRIFLSHSSIDELEAVALKEWLAQNGWGDVFLDLDPQRGLLAGERWQDALRRAADRCEAVVFVVTPAWAKSNWCQAEFLLAKSLNKRIFGAILKPVALSELPVELTAEWQLSQLVGDGPKEAIAFTQKGKTHQVEFLSDGLKRLRIGLKNAGLDASYFPWPPPDDPQRLPYRGLVPLDEKDAAIYFGRDAQIVRGLDALRGMRATGVETLFVLLGPSGCGKSSFLRAGLLPRLKRDDRHFVPLKIIRPERQAITGERGLANALHKACMAFGLSGQTLGAIKTALAQDTAQLSRLLIEIQRAARERLRVNNEEVAAPTLLLCVDQAEELFNPDATDEAPRFLALLGATLRETGAERPMLIVAFTVRSDRYEPLQTAPELAGLKSAVFDDLKPMPREQFKEIITGPADRATDAGKRLEVKPDLVNQLLQDCAQGADTLPLLALTLSRLYRDYGSDGDLRLDEYQAMGGMACVVNGEVESVLTQDPAKRDIQLTQLRAAFIPWLASINPQNDEPMRRLARYVDLPVQSHALIDALAEKRLLLIDQREGEKVVEVAHESLLRQWSALTGWLQDEREDLKLAHALEQATQDWRRGGGKADWLWMGERLSNAEGLAAKPGFRKRLDDCREFLLASRLEEDAKRAEEERRRQAELEAAQKLAAEQTARADVEAKARVEAQASAERIQKLFRNATGQRLVIEAQGMISRARSGGDERAMLQLLAAKCIAPGVEVMGALLSGLLQFCELKLIKNTSFTYGAFSPDGTRIVSEYYPYNLQLWDAKTGQPIGEPMQGHEGYVKSVAFSRDGTRIVSGSKDNTIRMWDANTGQPIGEPMHGHEGDVNSVAFSPDGTRIVSGSQDHTIRMWDASTGQLIGEPMQEYELNVDSVAFSPDGMRIVSGIYSILQLWDANTGQPIGEPMQGHESRVNSVAFSPDGTRIVSGSEDRTIRMWDANTGQPIGTPLLGHDESVTSVAFSPDGTNVISYSYDHTMRLWTANNIGQSIGVLLQGHVGSVMSVAFSPDGTRIVSGSQDQTLRLWDAQTGQPIGEPMRYFAGGRSLDVDVAFSSDGTRIVSCSPNQIIRLWDAYSGQPIGEPLHWHAERAVECTAFSPDGTRIVSAFSDHTIRMWDVNTGQPIGEPMQGHETIVHSVAFSPDGTRIVSGCGSTLQLWDANTGRRICAPMKGHRGAVSEVAFSPDGSTIISGGADGALRLSDASSLQTIGPPLIGHADSVVCVAFSPDGNRIVTGSKDTFLRLWPAPKVWPDELCKKLTRNMSRKQWRERVSPEFDYVEQCPGLPIPPDEPENTEVKP